MENSFIPSDQQSTNSLRVNTKKIRLCGAIALFAIAVVYIFFFSAPSDFPVGGIIRIDQGGSLHSISLELKNEHVIRSRILFEAFVILFNKEKSVISTEYYFESKISVYEVARRISRGEHHIAALAVTIPEGFDVNEIADTFAPKLLEFNKLKFLGMAKPLEGYLFPDTYFFFPTDTEKEVVDAMTKNFTKKFTPFKSDILKAGQSEKQIIVMASVVEREAKGDNDRAVISGILWRRLSVGMPLQVDAAPETYKMKGLPKSPISNPGLEAIKAAIYPQKSPYLYYLHDKNGAVHYAKTFAEHVANKQKYLK